MTVLTATTSSTTITNNQPPAPDRCGLNQAPTCRVKSETPHYKSTSVRGEHANSPGGNGGGHDGGNIPDSPRRDSPQKSFRGNIAGNDGGNAMWMIRPWPFAIPTKAAVQQPAIDRLWGFYQWKTIDS
jgi:hypothetical protein